MELADLEGFYIRDAKKHYDEDEEFASVHVTTW